MITITPTAAEQIINAAKQSGADNLGLRIAARVEHDGSISYGMGFDDEHEQDMGFVSEGVKVLISPDSQPMLTGTVIDFVEYQPGDFRFIFMNPNDRGSCAPSSGGGGGCGGCGGGCA